MNSQNMKLELLNLMQERNKLDSYLEAQGGEVTDTLETIIKELDIRTNEGLTTAVNILKNLSSSIETLRVKKEKIDDALRSREKNEEFLRQSIKTAMLLSGTKRLESDTHTFLIKQIADKLEVEREEEVPQEYFKEKIIRSLDKEAIKKDLKLNFKIEGVSLKENFSLTIKERL